MRIFDENVDNYLTTKSSELANDEDAHAAMILDVKEPNNDDDFAVMSTQILILVIFIFITSLSAWLFK